MGLKGHGREEKGEWKMKWKPWNREGRLNSKGRKWEVTVLGCDGKGFEEMEREAK